MSSIRAMKAEPFERMLSVAAGGRTPRSAAGVAWEDVMPREGLTAAPVGCSGWFGPNLYFFRRTRSTSSTLGSLDIARLRAAFVAS